jgi:hypothetical protein
MAWNEVLLCLAESPETWLLKCSEAGFVSFPALFYFASVADVFLVLVM